MTLALAIADVGIAMVFKHRCNGNCGRFTDGK